MNEDEVSKRLLSSLISLRHLFRKEPIGGLKRGEAGLLFMIHHHGAGEGMKVSEISGHLHVTSPSVTQMVTVLEAQGMVQRRMDPADRRIVRVSLTEEGTRAVLRAERKLQDSLAEIVRRVGPDKMLQLADLLEEIGAAAAQWNTADQDSGAHGEGPHSEGPHS